jgi:DeoR/GlpR family transcriptional regulator of sugar metabolism
MIDHRSILVGPGGVSQILAFIVENPQGVNTSSLLAKFDLASEETIRAALGILEEQGKIIAVDGETVRPVTHC